MTAIAQPSAHAPSRSLLRQALWFDALSVAGLGLLLSLPAAMLEPLLGLDAVFLRTVGVLLLPFAAFVGWVALRETPPRGAVLWIVGLNEVYVVASFAILLFGWVQPTALGAAFIVAQALVGAGVSVAEFVGLRRETSRAG